MKDIIKGIKYSSSRRVNVLTYFSDTVFLTLCACRMKQTLYIQTSEEENKGNKEDCKKGEKTQTNNDRANNPTFCEIFSDLTTIFY